MHLEETPMSTMKRLLIALLVGGQLGWSVPQLEARGCKRGGCGSSGPGCASDCGGGVGYVEQQVTAYRTECREKEVEVTVNRMVSRVVETPYKYTENVMVTTPQKRTETFYTCQTRQVPYTYNVVVPVAMPEKRTVTQYQCQTKTVPVTVNVCTPVYAPEKRTVTTYACVPQEVERKVPVCRMVPTACTDPCTGCVRTVCRPVTEWQTVKQTVMTRVPQTQEVTVNVCRMQTEQRTVNRTVTEMVPVTQEVTVNVCKYQTEQRTGTRMVSEMVPQTREVTVNVCQWQAVERTGVNRQMVCEVVPQKVKQKVTEVVMVPYTTTVRVPAGGCNVGGGCH
jgi:hypothetical protein